MELLYQNKDIRECENEAYSAHGYTPYKLMLAAGTAAWSYLRSHYFSANSITVCCGKGNNGGDGLVLALKANQHGLTVKVLMVEDSIISEASKQAFKACAEAGVSISPFSAECLADADLLVDALLGTGLSGDLREPYSDAVIAMNETGLPILSLDIATGLNADTGATSNPVILADSTVTFIGLKPGLVTTKGVACSGAVSVNDLGLSSLLQSIIPTAKVMHWDEIIPLFAKRCRDSHKGDHGHVLVVGGDYGMGGAVRLSAEAALRAGAGLVTVATRPEHVPVVSGTRPEIMCHQVVTSDDLDKLIAKANVVVIGPGLGQTAWAQELLDTVIASGVDAIYDADALNLMSENEKKQLLGRAIVTPHPGEAGRLLGCSSADIQADRYKSLKELVTLLGTVVVLKGAGSLVGSKDELPAVCRAGNPGMATAGMGDILTGIIGSLVAQGASLSAAARAGVLIHATAADKAAQDGGERGLLATDLLQYIRELVNPDGMSKTHK